jgi:AraC family transcriptional regulator
MDAIYSHHGTLNDRFCSILKELRFSDDVSPMVIEGLTLEILAKTYRFFKPKERGWPVWMVRVVDLLEARYSERLDLFSIAKDVDIHPTHPAREFRKHPNCTVGEYIGRKRVSYAYRKLVATSLPLADIAISAGFCDQSHLTRIFKEIVGVTPGEYRKATSS